MSVPKGDGKHLGNGMDEILIRPDSGENGAHPQDEDLALLAEGRLAGSKREKLIRHVNRCPRCHGVLAGILEEMSAAEAKKQSLLSRLSRSQLAVAASIVFAFLIGVGIFQQQTGSPDLLMATLAMDAEMRNLILEGGEKEWTDKGRIDRLAGLLKKNGVKVKGITKVVMEKPYMPTKSFFGPEEKVRIRIEDGVVYLDVVPKDEKVENSVE